MSGSRKETNDQNKRNKSPSDVIHNIYKTLTAGLKTNPHRTKQCNDPNRERLRTSTKDINSHGYGSVVNSVNIHLDDEGVELSNGACDAIIEQSEIYKKADSQPLTPAQQRRDVAHELRISGEFHKNNDYDGAIIHFGVGILKSVAIGVNTHESAEEAHGHFKKQQILKGKSLEDNKTPQPKR